MAQDTTPSIIMYQGGTDKFPVPFDKGYYGEVKVLFVRRGATGYEHEPASSNYVVNGRLYAWGAGSNYVYTHTPMPAVEAPVYNDQDVDSGKMVEATAGQTITVDGVSYIRATQHDISNHLILTWIGEELGVDDYICIGRDTERGQPYSLPNNQKHIEGALDNIERQVQELKDKTDNALVVDPTHTIDASKMGPIDWLETIVRSTDKTARAIRYHNGYLQFSLEDPDVPLDQKTWTSVLNTINITTIREWYDEEKDEYRFQYSKDNGVSWKELPINISTVPGLENRLATIENEQVVLGSGVKGNTEAIQKTREDYIQADSEIHQILNNHANELTTLRGNQASLGDQVSGIEEKIPESASGSNPLITKQQLLDEEMDIRDDVNQYVAELQTQITAQAGAITGLDDSKLDKNQGDINAGKYLVVGKDGNIELTTSGGGGGGGIGAVNHDATLKGNGTDEFPLGLADAIKDEIADKAPKETVEALTQILNGIIGDYVKKSGDTMIGGLTLPELTVETPEGALNISVTAGVATIATNNGLDIASQTKFDTAPTTDDSTTWANASGVSLVRKAQVATAIADAVANIDALPDQSGNAGKVLTTDGSTASWQEPQGGGTKVIIKRYN